MKSFSFLASVAALSTVCLAVGCSQKSDADKGSGGMGGTAGSGTAGSAGSGTAGSGDAGTAGSAGSGTAGSAGSGTAGTAGSGTAGGSGGPSSCSTGIVIEGDPLYNDKPDAGNPKPAGQPIMADPPIRNEAIAVIGNKLFVETEKEIWMADLSQASPTIARIAGLENGTFVDADKACKDTQFLVARDMTATADGKLALVDYVGGAVIEITDPGGPNCMSHFVAGTHAKTADPGDNYPLAQGDMDGPGATALFGGDKDVTGIGGAGIHKIAADPQGNYYTWDEGVGKFKKIATDTARTVSTIGKGSTDDNILGLAFLNGKLYATGVDGTNDFLIEIDPAAYNPAMPTANVHDVFRDREHFPEIAGTGHQAVLSQIISDGQALIVSGQTQFVWRIAADGTVLATLAGSLGPSGPGRLDYDSGFDPLVSHPADEWELVSSLSNSDGGPWLALSDGKLYWSGGLGIGKYIVQFSCP